jgi:cytochrome c
MKRALPVCLTILAISTASAQTTDHDATTGARVFRACSACHSLEKDRNMTGPSLAGVWNRKAGTLGSFSRYSDAMKHSGITWDEQSLDGYLKNPSEFMPGNHMTFPGIPDEKARSSVIAFLKSAAETPGDQARASQSRPGAGSMQGMGTMQGRAAPKLKTVDASSRVKSITYCRDTFRVTTQDGKSREFWERNLRFKTDSSDEGPDKEAPAIVAAGMMGDRASVIFSSPDEISRFIKTQC